MLCSHLIKLIRQLYALLKDAKSDFLLIIVDIFDCFFNNLILHPEKRIHNMNKHSIFMTGNLIKHDQK